MNKHLEDNLAKTNGKIYIYRDKSHQQKLEATLLPKTHNHHQIII